MLSVVLNSERGLIPKGLEFNTCEECAWQEESAGHDKRKKKIKDFGIHLLLQPRPPEKV